MGFTPYRSFAARALHAHPLVVAVRSKEVRVRQIPPFRHGPLTQRTMWGCVKRISTVPLNWAEKTIYLKRRSGREVPFSCLHAFTASHLGSSNVTLAQWRLVLKLLLNWYLTCGHTPITASQLHLNVDHFSSCYNLGVSGESGSLRAERLTLVDRRLSQKGPVRDASYHHPFHRLHNNRICYPFKIEDWLQLRICRRLPEREDPLLEVGLSPG